ncbi:MAG: response regulator transcription factor [Chitinophagaceae bacterium]
MTNKISIMIVDDHVLVAEMWAEIINSDPRFSVTDICDNTDKAIEMVKLNRPDIVIMDINIQPISGIDATKQIKKISPGTKVIGVSMHNQPSFAKRMLKSGAQGYVTKSSPKHEMFDAITAAINGKIYICKEIQENLSKQILIEDDDNSISKLTEREIEILKLIKEGLSSKEIGEKIYLSFRTIEVHRSNILRKLNQKNTPSLIKFINNSSLDI